MIISLKMISQNLTFFMKILKKLERERKISHAGKKVNAFPLRSEKMQGCPFLSLHWRSKTMK